MSRRFFCIPSNVIEGTIGLISSEGMVSLFSPMNLAVGTLGNFGGGRWRLVKIGGSLLCPGAAGGGRGGWGRPEAARHVQRGSVITPVAAPRNSCWKCEYRLKLVQIIYNDFYKTLEDPRCAKCIGADIVSILDRLYKKNS